MRLKNVLIVVSNLEKSKKFYRELFGLRVILEQEGNVILTEGLVLQEAKLWKEHLQKEVVGRNHAMELYFEENNLDVFEQKIKDYPEEIIYVTPVTEYNRGQKVMRIYDPDGNLIEVRSRN